MERRWSVKPLVRLTAEVRFLSSALEKERGVTGQHGSLQNRRFRFKSGRSCQRSRRVRITVLQQSRKLPGFGL